MKIRAIKLTNVRRFAAKSAEISGIADGISVISAPNEYGKSTFFDALHAVFFQKHTGRPDEVMSLQPHAGGSPEVAVEIETAAGRYLIEKRFLAGKFAKVTDLATGRLLAQSDEAEAWLGRLVTSGGGPSGLLWVRQGALTLQPDKKPEQERMLDARRSLLSSVAGEVEAMTGGRRMDAILAATNAGIAVLATTRGAKADGPWGKVQKERAELEANLVDLTVKCDRLRDELEERAQVLQGLAVLQNPEDLAQRTQKLRQAEAVLLQAEAQARVLEAAQTTLRLAQAEDRQAAERLVALDRAEEQARAAAAAFEAAEVRLQVVMAEREAAVTAEGLAATAFEAAGAEHGRLAAALDQGHRAMQAQVLRERLAGLEAALVAAEEARRQDEAAAALAAAIAVDGKAVARLEALERACDLARARADAGGVRLEVRYDAGAQGFSVAGRALAEGARAVLHGVTEVVAAGIGRLVLTPAEGGAEAAVALAEADTALAAASAALGLASVGDARAELARRADALQLASAARARCVALAPDGLEALRAAVVAARGAVQGVPDAVPDIEALRGSVEAAAVVARAGGIARDRAREARVERGEAAVAARAARDTALRDCEAAEAVLGPVAARSERRLAVQAARAAAVLALEAAEQRHAGLAAGAADIVTLRAEFDRAASAVRAADEQERRLLDRQLVLSAQIGSWAEDGVEERRAEVEGRLEAVRHRDGLYSAEVAALVRLRGALEAARSAAKDRYFAPVMAELLPLLRVLHGDGELVMDDVTLLPRALVRGGVEESLDILSGGTREQIAVLTRLAFARLLAKAGEGVPVVLDDALVFSDDDRIEAMFTALHRVAQGQQIIVFTCRSRAFRSLGGDWPQIRVAAL